MTEVHKFGGSVLQDPVGAYKILSILNSSPNRKVMVVSALYGVTDRLIELLTLSSDSIDYSKKFNDLYLMHVDFAGKLGVKHEDIDLIFAELELVLAQKKNDPASKDMVVSFGEVLSARILLEFFLQHVDIALIDSRGVIKTDECFGSASVDFISSNRLIASAIEPLCCHVIMPGFIASAHSGFTTTLGRNGSDYSAAIIANAISASGLRMWKDVDGLYSADPKIVPNARFIDKIAYEEIKELACFGNKIVHIKTLNQLEYRQIPITIHGIDNPAGIGTTISKRGSHEFEIKGVSRLNGVGIVSLMLTYNGLNRPSVEGFLRLVFSRFRDAIVNISEVMMQDKVSVVLHGDHVDRFLFELERGFLDMSDVRLETRVKRDKAVIAVIGLGLADQPGVSGKIFNLLKKERINVYAVQDDLSEARISFVVDVEDSERSVSVVHAGIFDRH